MDGSQRSVHPLQRNYELHKQNRNALGGSESGQVLKYSFHGPSVMTNHTSGAQQLMPRQCQVSDAGAMANHISGSQQLMPRQSQVPDTGAMTNHTSGSQQLMPRQPQAP